ncbi:MAG: MarR family transcriptional regulator [Erysipelotrichaceae bacterium]|nr:MarR family transcriptional regulator [Erysipelotrichaceae bacterium]
MEKYDCLKLDNQLCFPLYSAANKIVRSYKPLLDKLDLTYTQYITMMVLWEEGDINEKELGRRLFLKSNTLAPLLKKLEAKKYISIKKDKKDARNIVISLTESGEKLKEEAVNVPPSVASTINLSEEEAANLYKILYKYLEEGEEEL